MASSVPLVSVKSSGSTSKNAASSCFTWSYSGYTARLPAWRCSRRYSTTRGEAPTVFSLKSSRSLSPRPPVGGLYGAILNTASRGCNTPGGKSIFLLPKTHLHGTGVRFQTLRASESGDGRSQPVQRFGRQLLHRNYLDEVGGRKAATNPSGSRRRQNVIRTGRVITRSFRTARAHEDAARVLYLRQETFVIDHQMLRRQPIGCFHSSVNRRAKNNRAVISDGFAGDGSRC